MAPQFSIIMPSIRPLAAQKTLEQIYATLAWTTFEVVIVSPQRFTGPNIVWVHEQDPRGSIPAQAMGWQASRGDIVVCLNDDIMPEPGWSDRLPDLLAEKERRYFPFVAGLNGYEHFGSVYGLYYAFFPIASRRSLEAIGGWFNNEYIFTWGDPDLGMRTWHKGGRCELLPDRYVTPHPNRDVRPPDQVKFDRDFATFRSKWHALYGAGFTEEFRHINVDYPLPYLTDNTFIERAPPEIVAPRLPYGVCPWSVRRPSPAPEPTASPPVEPSPVAADPVEARPRGLRALAHKLTTGIKRRLR